MNYLEFYPAAKRRLGWQTCEVQTPLPVTLVKLWLARTVGRTQHRHHQHAAGSSDWLPSAAPK